MAEKGSDYSVLIAGGTKGIGLATALRIARPGARMFLNYRSDDAAAKQAAARITERGATPHLIRADIGSAESARGVIDQVAALTDRLDVLVHTAAVPNPGYLAEQTLADVMRAINVGGLALLYLVQPAMKLLGEGSAVLFLSGSAVDLVLPHHGALAAAKALGECMIRYMAIECAPKGINFNTLRTGPVDTELFRSVRAPSTTGEPVLPPVTPNGRRLSVDDIAETAAFLVSPAASMIRGQCVMVDGALSTTVRAR
jgi:NAD(P)-dependent dehydrogenase (short-subunit alcohol dehydrogenase family)